MNQPKFILIASGMLCFSLSAQDVEKVVNETKTVLKEDPVHVTGSFGANSVFYKSVGVSPRRDPFYYTLSANLNISIMNKVTIPFSAILTRKDTKYTNGLDQYSKPFSQFGISPRYRWLTVHAGYRSLEFSEYSLAGALFLGGGFEIKPERSFFSASGIYGRFEKAIPKGGIDGLSVDPAVYERWGGAAKVSAGTSENSVDFIFMKIADKIGTTAFDTANNVLPKENEVIAIGTKQKMSRLINIQGDLAFSMYTNNLYQQVSKIRSYSYINQIYSPRPSTHYDKALNLACNFSPGKITLGAKYKRIDPDYRTLGGVFLTNDLEELSFSAGSPFFKNKLNINGAIGTQRNNLDRIQLYTSKRIIGSINLSASLRPEIVLNLNYSSFSSNSLPIRNAFTDIVNFVQLTQSGNFSFSCSKSIRTVRHSVNSNTSFQQSGGTDLPLVNYLNESLSYGIGFDKSGTNLNLTLMFNGIEGYQTGEQKGYGPSVSIQQSLLNRKIRTGVSCGYQDVHLGSQLLSRNFTSNINLNYQVDKHQSFRCDFSYIQRKAVAANVVGYGESRATLSYVYQFLLKKKTPSTVL